MAINRSEFLRLSVWGFLATLLPIHQVKALAFITDLKQYDPKAHKLAVTNAKLAKEAFFKKDYKRAESLYLECIKLAPADIRFYDNLQNVYGAQGKWLLCTELFKNALIANPKKEVFYDRAARSLMRLELGYKSVAEKYRSQTRSKSLLEDAKELYNQALKFAPKASYLHIGLEKVEQKITMDAVKINYRANSKEKQKRKDRRNAHKKRYNDMSNKDLVLRLNSFDSRKRNTLYFKNELNTREKNIIKEKKQIYRLLTMRLKKEKQYKEAITYAKLIFEIDNQDSWAINILKELYERTNNYVELVNLQRIHNKNQQTVYSNLGLMRALNLQHENGSKDSSLLRDSINIGEDLMKNWGLSDSLLVKVSDQLANTHILNRSYSTAKKILEEIMTSTQMTTECQINDLICSYAKVHFMAGEYKEARAILSLGLKEYEQVENEKFSYVKTIADKKEESSFNANLKFHYLLHKTCERLNDKANQQDILDRLLQNNPLDKFALKRIQN